MRHQVVVSLVMPKGGTGKSTLAANLATAAHEDGWTPLIIDTDPQVSACNWADRRGKDTSPQVISAMPARLKQTIASAADMGVDFFVIDTPPISGEAGLAAARIADLVLSPCGTTEKEIEALDKLSDTLSIAGNPECLVVLTKVSWLSFKRQQRARQDVEAKGFHICDQALTGPLSAYDDADKKGLSVLEFQPEGRAAQEVREVYKQISQLIDKLASRGEKHAEHQSRRAV